MSSHTSHSEQKIRVNDGMRGFWNSILLILGATLLSLLFLELGVRVLNGIPVLSTDNFVARALDTRLPIVAGHDPQVGWVQKDNVRLPSGSGTMTTGQFGVRLSNPTAVTLQQGAVLALGDSLTVGSEVSDEQTWPANLESMIGKQVINAAVGGYSFDQSVLRAEILIPQLHPQVVLIELAGITALYTGLSIYAGGPKPYFRIENGQLVLHNVPVPALASGMSDLGVLRAFLGHSYLAHFIFTRLNVLQWWVATPLRYQWASSADEGLRISCLLMKRLAQLRDRSKVRLSIVIQYGGTEPLDAALGWDRATLLKCIRAEGLQLADMYDALKSVYDREGEAAYKRLWVMSDNNRAYGHMSPAGNRLVAQMIAAQLFNTNTSDMKPSKQDTPSKAP